MEDIKLILGVVFIISIVFVPLLLLFFKDMNRRIIPCWQNFMRLMAESLEIIDVKHTTMLGFPIIGAIHGIYRGREVFCKIQGWEEGVPPVSLEMKCNPLDNFYDRSSFSNKNTAPGKDRVYYCWPVLSWRVPPRMAKSEIVQVLEELFEACHKAETVKL